MYVFFLHIYTIIVCVFISIAVKVRHFILFMVFLLQTYAAEGRFTFTSHSAGEHIICLNSNSTAWIYSGQLVSKSLKKREAKHVVIQQT